MAEHRGPLLTALWLQVLGLAASLGLASSSASALGPFNCSNASNVSLCESAQSMWNQTWQHCEAVGNATINESESHQDSMSPMSGAPISPGSQTPTISSAAPNSFSRDATFYDWCECGTGLQNVTFWPNDDWERRVTLTLDTTKYVSFGVDVHKVKWICNGMDGLGWTFRWHDMVVGANQWLSLYFYSETKDVAGCSSVSGRLHWNTWSPVSYATSVPFVSGAEGYPCYKIPVMLTTQSGAILAFAEARTPDCDDYARTDLVYKRSTDGGLTWSPLKPVVNVTGDTLSQGVCGHEIVVGNAAPVQLRQNSSAHPGRIIVPYTRNNFKIWMIHSDDDGLTWSGDHEIPNVTETDETPDCNRDMSYFGLNLEQWSWANAPDVAEWIYSLCTQQSPFDDPSWLAKLTGPWQFIGTGPPGTLQLRSGRLLVPSYRAYIRGLPVTSEDLGLSQLYNNFALGFVLISDDDGVTWRRGSAWPVSNGANENQMVELPDGSVLTNSRALSTGSPQMRLQARSFDEGETFAATQFAPDLPQPFNGCQGSTLKGGPQDAIFVTTPDPTPPTSVAQGLVDLLGCTVKLDGRNRLTSWKSLDWGTSYTEKYVVDPGLAAQTSLQMSNGRLVVLHEQSDPLPQTPSNLFQQELIENLRVLTPTRFVFRELPLNLPPSPPPSTPGVTSAGSLWRVQCLGFLFIPLVLHFLD